MLLAIMKRVVLSAVLLFPLAANAAILVSAERPAAPPVARVQETPRIAGWDDESMVVWVEHDAAPGAWRSLLAARVDPAGRILNDKPIVIRQDPDIELLKIVWAPNAYYVFWIERSFQPELLCQTVYHDGSMRSSPHVLQLNPGSIGVGANGTNMLVVDGMFSYPVKRDGIPAGSRQLTTQLQADWRMVSAPRVASNGDDYFVAFTATNGSAWKVFGARMSADNQPLDGAAPIEIAAGTQPYEQLAATWDGRDYVVAYSFDSTTTAQKVLPSGALDGDAVPIADAAADLDIAHAAFGTAALYRADDGPLLAKTLGSDSTEIAARASGVSTSTSPVLPGLIAVTYIRIEDGFPRVFVRQIGNVPPSRVRAVRH